MYERTSNILSNDISIVRFVMVEHTFYLYKVPQIYKIVNCRKFIHLSKCQYASICSIYVQIVRLKVHTFVFHLTILKFNHFPHPTFMTNYDLQFSPFESHFLRKSPTLTFSTQIFFLFQQ